MSLYRYDIGCTSLGAVLVVFQNQSLIHIAMGDDAESLKEEVQQYYPTIFHSGLEHAQKKMFQAILNFVEAPSANLDLPIQIQGSAFQQQVWSALQAVPLGETRSYSDIAKAIGKPKAVRAVATACAANRLALIIPCHRVMGKNGSLAGYRWGVARKQALLEREQLMRLEQHQMALIA